MTRSSFLKSLFVLTASPKVLADLKTEPKMRLNSGIINDLKFVVPDYSLYPCPADILRFYDQTGNLLVGDMKTFRHFEIPNQPSSATVVLRP